MFFEKLLFAQTTKAQKRLAVGLYIFLLLGSSCIKAAHKMSVKLTPGVNFINILHAHFAPIFWCQKLQS